MKKVLTITTIIITMIGIFTMFNKTYAASISSAIDEKTESKLIEIKSNEAKSLEDYKEKYGSSAYRICCLYFKYCKNI